MGREVAISSIAFPDGWADGRVGGRVLHGVILGLWLRLAWIWARRLLMPDERYKLARDG